jgi:hypothetical protein
MEAREKKCWKCKKVKMIRILENHCMGCKVKQFLRWKEFYREQYKQRKEKKDGDKI